jgi:hypothetical protein
MEVRKMKKILGMILGLFLFVAMVSASSLTVISGTVFDGDGNPVADASISVECNGNYKYATTDGNGDYKVVFPQSKCADGDSVTITAEKDGLGSNTNEGTVEGGECIVDTAIIDVTIPEFTVIAAGLALVGAVAGFAVMRRN